MLRLNDTFTIKCIIRYTTTIQKVGLVRCANSYITINRLIPHILRFLILVIIIIKYASTWLLVTLNLITSYPLDFYNIMSRLKHAPIFSLSVTSRPVMRVLDGGSRVHNQPEISGKISKTSFKRGVNSNSPDPLPEDEHELGNSKQVDLCDMRCVIDF